MNREFSRYGILFVISAPSGAGKSTLCAALRQTPDFVYSVSCTTRPARAGEINGEDYLFLTEAEFLARVKAGEFLEHARVHEHYYGTLRKTLVENLKKGIDVLIDVDTQGAAAIRNCDDDFIRGALADVFIMPPNLDELRRYQEAIAEYEKALELEPRHPAIHRNLAIVLAQVGRSSEAIRHLRTVLEIVPNEPYARDLLQELERNSRGSSQ